jgi:hypothetical protein
LQEKVDGVVVNVFIVSLLGVLAVAIVYYFFFNFLITITAITALILGDYAPF